MNNNAPFSIGQKVVVVTSFEELRKIWGFNYPVLNEEVVIVAIRKHPKYNFWLVEISTCECEMCHKCFAPIITNYSDATSEILEKFKSPNETPDRIIVPEKETA